MDVARALSSRLPHVTVSADGPDRVAYARDLWPRRLIDVRAGKPAPDERRPAAIVWPRSVDDVISILALARDEGVAVVPFGAGSGVCGGVDPNPRTIVVDLKNMADFVIRPDAPLLDVGPGAMGITLEERIACDGFTIGHFPSSILCSTVGGWIAARGAGQCSGKYGKIEDMVAEVECVLGTGEVVRMPRRTHGPDLTPLVIGSEGTLGVITRAKLRLHPVPAARAFSAYSFASTQHGWEAMRELFQAGLRPAVARLYDPIDSAILRQGSVKSSRDPARGVRQRRSKRSPLVSVLRAALRVPQALNALIEASEGNLLGGATLILIFEGSSDEVHPDRDRADSICRAQGGRPLGEGPAHQWLGHRYSVSYRQSPVFRLGAFSDTMEVAASWSNLGALYDAVRAALGKHVLVMAHLSHAYPDGCSIYFTFSAVARDDAAALELYDRAWHDALSAAIGAGGTLSHHHGVGRSKAPRLGDELGAGVDVVRRLMRACDPAGILNPGCLAAREAPSHRSGVDSVPRGPEIDQHSLLASFAGETPLSVAEALLAGRGLTLAIDPGYGPPGTTSITDWIARGTPGSTDPWLDPVDQRIAGLVARLHSGELLTIHPAPRRAVGPDLVALFHGAAERIGTVVRATLRVQRIGAPRARALPFTLERNPLLSEAEERLWQRLAAVQMGAT
jgi:alkyldihydroxyacetonephosphate synthase